MKKQTNLLDAVHDSPDDIKTEISSYGVASAWKERTSATPPINATSPCAFRRANTAQTFVPIRAVRGSPLSARSLPRLLRKRDERSAWEIYKDEPERDMNCNRGPPKIRPYSSFAISSDTSEARE